jgi:GNAT superfamily N-acetyltransferase
MATEADAEQLATMRWEFSLEDGATTPAIDQAAFIQQCAAFLRQGVAERRWSCWVAVLDGVILSHIFIQRIEKIPRPDRLDSFYGYVTNVYTRPVYRSQGIGAELMERVLVWAREQDLEFMIVWPSEESVRFYERAGFRNWQEPVMEYPVRL